MMYTSAEAGKLVKKIEDELKRQMLTERKSYSFVVASGEDVESLRPKYEFAETQKNINELQEKLRIVKHAINQFNLTHTLPGFDGLTIDQALIMLPQLNSRRTKYQEMINRLPKERISGIHSRNNLIEYNIANYNIEEVEKAYKELTSHLAKMQLALDTVNTTEKMEIPVVE